MNSNLKSQVVDLTFNGGDSMTQAKGKIIEYIKEKREITIPEVQVKFNLDYKTTFQVFNEAVETKLIYLSDGLTYKLLNNNSVIEKTSKETEDIASARMMLERRKQEILRRMQLEVEDDEEDDEEDEPSSDDIDDALRQIDNELKIEAFNKTRLSVLRSLSRGVYVNMTTECGKIDIDICYPNDVKYDLLIKWETDKVYFTDQQLTLKFMNENLDMQQEELVKKVNLIKDRYGISMVGEELRCYVSDPENALIALFYFLTAIEQLVYIVREDFIHILSDKIEKRCESILCELLCKVNVKDKTEIMKMINADLEKAKSNNLYDDIIAYEHILTGLNMISDDYFKKLIENYLKNQKNN